MLRKKIELFRKVFRQFMGINKFIKRMTAVLFFPSSWTGIHYMVQQKIGLSPYNAVNSVGQELKKPSMFP
ncbi:hypothetical protein BOX30_11545, partial [Leptospirillum ferriphilum]